MSRTPRASRGNALMEYGLSSVLLISGLAYVYVQNNWPDKLAQLQQAMLNAGPSATAASLAVPSLGTIVRENKAANLQNQKICFQSGSCVDLPIIPAGATVADTTGAMGGELTARFSKVIQDLAAELAAKNADPILVQLITELANAGHATANYVKTTENIITKYDCDVRTCSSDFIPYWEMWRISRGMNEAKKVYYETIMAGKYTHLNEYLSAHPELVAAFPESKAIIDLEYQQIGKLLEGGADYGCADPMSSCGGIVTQPVELPITPTTKTLTDPATGETVAVVTYYMQGSPLPLYETVTMQGVSTTYKIGIGNVRTIYTEEIPTSKISSSGVSMEAHISNQSAINTAELVHQDSNVICGSGGDVNNCVINPAL